jgi:hypothetical protein
MTPIGYPKSSMSPTATRKWAAAGAACAFALCASVLRRRIQWLGTSHEERTAP